jgi:hypothetical protein
VQQLYQQQAAAAAAAGLVLTGTSPDPNQPFSTPGKQLRLHDQQGGVGAVGPSTPPRSPMAAVVPRKLTLPAMHTRCVLVLRVV